MSKIKGFTLMEVTIVIVILGILATLSMTHYIGTRERALDREAQANLKLIQAAERIYNFEEGILYPSPLPQETDIGNINRDLRLLLPANANRNWDYGVRNDGCIWATRNLPVGDPWLRSWFLEIDDADDEPNRGNCP